MATAKADPVAPPSTGFGLPRLIPSLPVNMLNSINPFASSPENTKSTAEMKETDTGGDGGFGVAFLRRPLFGSILPRPLSMPPQSSSKEDGNGHKKSRSTVLFAEPEVTDSEIASREGSVVDDTQRRRKSARNKTAFSLCHPPPASSARQKMHRRPRSMLQLHKLSTNARPVPAFEVIPSANFNVRLVKAITKTYKAKHGLCPNDLVILQAEKYYTQEHDSEQRDQDIVALICRGKSNEHKAKIIMSDGEEWDASSHTAGGYDFSTVDGHGLDINVRWWPKKSRDGKQSRDKRFNFSTIAAGTRKHPVIATLSKTNLEINDTYKVPDPLGSTPLSTPKHGESILATTLEAEDNVIGDDCVTDDRLRDIIAVTAIFVSFNECWSGNGKDDENTRELALSPKIGSPRKMDRSTSTPPASPAQLQVQMLEKRGSIRSIGSGIFRRSTTLATTDGNSVVSVDSITSTDTTNNAPTAAKHGRSRSDSASTVLVHRAASNRRKAKKQATWRPDLLSVQNSVPETSREDLSRVPSAGRTIRSPSPLARNVRQDGAQTTSEEDDDGEGGDSEAERSADAALDPAKRESCTTTDTNGSESKKTRSHQKKQSSPPKKVGRWRKMLSCMK